MLYVRGIRAAPRRLLDRIAADAFIRVENGSEFIFRYMDLWAYQRSVTLDFSRPGKPTDYTSIKACIGRFRAGCLDAHRFTWLEDTAEKLEA